MVTSHVLGLFTGAGAQWDKGTFVKPCGMIQLMLLEDQSELQHSRTSFQKYLHARSVPSIAFTLILFRMLFIPEPHKTP